MTVLPVGGRAVLSNVAAGRSPWHGWEGGHAAKTPEGQEAYSARALAITQCRERGLLTAENLLTDAGREVIELDPAVTLLNLQGVSALDGLFPVGRYKGGRS